MAVNAAKTLTETMLNKIVADFDYGVAERNEKPSSNFKALKLRQNSTVISQSAAQTWL